MQKTKKIFIVICSAIFAIIGTSCEKENVFSTQKMSAPVMSNEIECLYRQMPSRDYSSVTVVGDDILKFQSLSHYDQICQQLKADCILWDSLFYDAYGRMEEMKLMDWMDSIGYDEYLPIVMFENALGVMGTRLFDSQRDAILEWSENEFRGDNPTDKIFIFEWEQALYNEHREVCIGDTIYQFRVDAMIAFPLNKIREWLEIRMLSMDELLEMEGVIVKIYSSDGWSAQEKVPFVCSAVGEYNVDNMPEVFSGLDYSYWVVRGKVRWLSQESRLDSKLVNYKFHKRKKNGKKVFKTMKRNCCIQTLYQKFYRDHKSLSGNLIYTTEKECIISQPSPKMQNKASGEAYVVVPYKNLNCPVIYERGVYQYPVLYIHIDGYDQYPIIYLQHN